MVLSTRLQTIANYVPNGACVADIGCDHALLSIYLAKSGQAKRVLACDINEGPLSVARANVEKAGLADQIELRLCNGLDAVADGEADTVVIAGMGGELMADILSRAPWVESHGVTLVLQPMSRPEVLRDFLYRHGFSVTKEEMVLEHRRVYTLIQAVYNGQPFVPTELQTHLGALPQGGAAEQAYLQSLGHRLQKAAKSCAQSPRKAEAAAHFAHLAEQILKAASEMN